MGMHCLVCGSPTASTLHFGARACKACAAFFRRSVSMRMNYECVSKERDGRCRIHYELRMICRGCRFRKCIDAGMQRELVQNRKDVDVDEREVTAAGRGEGVGRSRKRRSTCHSNYEPRSTRESLSEPEPHISQQAPPCKVVVVESGEEFLFQQEYTSEGYGSHSGSETSTSPLSIDLNSFPEGPASARNFFTSIPAEPTEAYVEQTIADHVSSELNLNERRRIIHTNCHVVELFNGTYEHIYSREDLKEMDLTEYAGHPRPDLMAVFEYVKSLPGFNEMERFDKSVFYRHCVAVDTILGAGYLTYRLGLEEGLLVHVTGHYIKMEPVPPSGNEPNARYLLAHLNDFHFEKYRVWMPMKVRQYTDVALPLADLRLSFHEFCLLKALAIWHFAHFKLSSEGRYVCERQRDFLMKALHRVASDEGYDADQRLGSIILFLSNVFEVLNNLIEGYVKISFFDLADIDPMIKNMVSFVY